MRSYLYWWERDALSRNPEVNDSSVSVCTLVFRRACVQIGLMNSVDAANLREQAAHSRRLADMIGDERASRALIELAEEYEAKAAAARKEEAQR